MSSIRLHFLGAADTVTGSRYLLETPGLRTLVDCGLFQGLKLLRLRNRAPFPFDPASLDSVVLTHAHIDHSGALPLLVREGFRGAIRCSEATRALLGLLLPDSGHLHEMEAERANRKGYSRHHPALPLYTEQDARRALEFVEAVPFEEEIPLGTGLHVRLRRSGHILGAASLRFTLEDGTRIVFSGDVGRRSDPVMPRPEPFDGCEWLVVESTYGDREHPQEDPSAVLREVILRATSRGGAVVIPAFAVGRAQHILHCIAQLRVRGGIPAIPVVLDSPMAGDVTRFLLGHPWEHRLTPEEVAAIRDTVQITNSVQESRDIDEWTGPQVILSASGMATGGRVLFHLARFAPDPRSIVVLVGYQAAGTRGASLASGARTLRIHGADVPVRAEVIRIDGLSAHADASGLMEWIGHLRAPPKGLFVTHGEPSAADALRARIRRELGWEARVPEHGSAVELESSRSEDPGRPGRVAIIAGPRSDGHPGGGSPG